MESEAKYTLVGVFVVAMTIAIVVAVMWLSKSGGTRHASRYTVYFQRQPLSGLQENAWVTMKGIKVGNVDSLQIAPANIEKVKVVIHVDEKTPVKTDTKAVLERNLLTGIAWIDLVESSQGAERLTEVLPEEEFPIIPEGRSRLEAVAASLPEVLADIGALTRQAKEVLNEENLKRVHDTLQNLDKFSAELAADDGSLQTLLKNLNGLSGDAAEMTKSVSAFSKSGRGQLEELTRSVKSDLERLTEMLTNLNQQVTDVGQTFKGSAQVATQDFGTIAQSVAQASRSLSAAAEQFTNLRAVLTGPSERSLGPGETTEAP